jgi:hypothetical protein
MWWTVDGQLVVPNVRNDTENLYRVDMSPITVIRADRYDSCFAARPFLTYLREVTRSRTPICSNDNLGILDPSTSVERQFPPTPMIPAGVVLGWRSPTVVVLSDGGHQGVISTFDIKAGSHAKVLESKDAGGYLAVRDEVLEATAENQSSRSVLKARALRTGATRTITTIDRMGSEYRASVDGRLVAYSRFSGTRGDAVIGMDGTGDRLLLSGKRNDPLAWSPNGKWLLYLDWGGDNMRVLDMATSQSWPLSEALDRPGWDYQEASWAPDGSFIVVAGDAVWKDAVGKVFEGVTYDAIAKLRGAAGHAGARR